MQKTKIFNRSVAASSPVGRTRPVASFVEARTRHGNRASWLQLEFIAHKVFPSLPLADDRKSVAAN